MAYSPVFKVNGVDFTHLLPETAIRWSRNDIDTQKTGRSTMDGKMYRKRLAIKRKLQISCRRMDTATMIALNKSLLPETIQVTFLDAIEGQVTKTFYGATVEAATMMMIGDETYWTDCSFALTEV